MPKEELRCRGTYVSEYNSAGTLNCVYFFKLDLEGIFEGWELKAASQCARQVISSHPNVSRNGVEPCFLGRSCSVRKVLQRRLPCFAPRFSSKTYAQVPALAPRVPGET
jgi:hypothetical protein